MIRAGNLMLLFIVALVALGCDSGDGGNDGGLAGPPEAMWGDYDVRLFGVWYGTCSMLISTGAILEDLHADNEGWVSELNGRHHADSVEEVDGAWAFTFHMDVMTEHGPDEQSWEFGISEDGLTADGFEGTYTHTSHFTGTSGGTIRGTRQD